MRPQPRYLVFAVLAVLLFGLVGSGASSLAPPVALAQQGSPTSVTGQFVVVYSHPTDAYFVIDDQNPGRRTRILVDEAVGKQAGGLHNLRNRRVTVNGVVAGPPPHAQGNPPVQAQSIQLAPGQATRGAPAAIAPATGPKPWVTVLCKFADRPTTSPDPTWYDQLLKLATAPGLKHYHGDPAAGSSYGRIWLEGSTTAPRWYSLPKPESAYKDVLGNFDYFQAADDCTAAADGEVDFYGYYGINMVFNGDALGTAAGCQCVLSPRDRKTDFGTAWYSWTYSQYQSVWAHEMGHGFGLPHSGGPRTRQFRTGEYNNWWDVMGYPYNGASPYTYQATHTIAYHKLMLGWVMEDETYRHPGGTQRIKLQALGSAPLTPGSYYLAHVPISGTTTEFYTVELRGKSGPYEGLLPGSAVIIHEVDTTASVPAVVVDNDRNGNTNDEGTMWKAGETFTAGRGANRISIRVESIAPDGNAANVIISR